MPITAMSRSASGGAALARGAPAAPPSLAGGRVGAPGGSPDSPARAHAGPAGAPRAAERIRARTAAPCTETR
ncbi:hypothetical protein BURPS1710b_A2620 [Burkholderia pseudomallei 1710b]|uniref:Uncharacterized protein n=1 Tax=Burkholderia pseudomallei (strain 1710b) TaxID=320372 RepID=Q3JF84_BURP1|nr:hypothetical protein BURPS1710b_A2620 [Burkholderia pseudomallei 1710b]